MKCENFIINNEYYNMYTYLRLLFLSDCMG